MNYSQNCQELYINLSCNILWPMVENSLYILQNEERLCTVLHLQTVPGMVSTWFDQLRKNCGDLSVFLTLHKASSHQSH